MAAMTSETAGATSRRPDTAIGAPRGEFSRGWLILVAATIGVGLGTTGLPFYSFGQFVLPVSHEFGWSRGAMSGGISCLMIGTVLTSPFVGRAVDTFGVRVVAVLSQIGLALGFLGVSFVDGSLGWFFAAWLALSFLGSGTSPIVWTRAVAGHFERSRGLALGIMLCGTGLVAIAAPLVISPIIAEFGWRVAYRVLAATLVVVGLPITLALLRDRPAGNATAQAGTAQAGTAPDGEAAGLAPALSGTSLGEAIRGSAFWRLELAFFLISVVVGGLIVHLTPLLVDRGFTPIVAAHTVASLGYAIIVGRLSLGALVDRFPPALVGAGLIALSALSCLLLALGAAPLPATLLLGLCAGAEVDLLAFLVSQLFGLRHYAQIYGWGISAFTAGAGVGPLIAGKSHDLTGSYTTTLYGYALVILVAAALIGSLGSKVAPSHAIARG